ncbi:ATP-binding protein [Cryptosporangium sp. NPDC051539]|uniref:ATP-binding protein n=1 Tax=Cryptosporangium sp. NPDC051539 TaxID=3363962 RepID=UPI0037B25EEE
MRTGSPSSTDGPRTPSDGTLRLQILGPLRIWRHGVELETGPAQQAALLAVLLARAGRAVGTAELINLIWGDGAPGSAVNTVRRYVGALRRALEPGLPPRRDGSYLRRRDDGYVFVAGQGTLDVVDFRARVAAARAEPDRTAALESYASALEVWRGPAGDGVRHGAAAAALFAGLDEEFFAACRDAVGLAVPLGCPERVLRPLWLAAAMAPLHEEVQAALVTTLAAAGRHAEALVSFDAVRARLADELGVLPGSALRHAHEHALERAATPAARPGSAGVGEPSASALIGRVEEGEVLTSAVEQALSGGTGSVVVEGEPGVGKTRLLEEAAADATGRGASVVWGQCLDGDGTPSMWPWIRVASTLLDGRQATTRAQWLATELGRLLEPEHEAFDAPLLPESDARFRLFERVVSLVGDAAARRPLVVVIDDLHWGDAGSLELFGYLARHLPAGTALCGALRTHAPVPGSDLTRVLAGVSRVPGHRRIRLGPLTRGEAAEIVRQEAGPEVSVAVTQNIYTRSAGNPFFVRELARLLAVNGGLSSGGSVAEVPATVRDVVRNRLAGLGGDTRDLLRIAALIGREVDVGLLARVAGIDVPACLHRLEPVDALGLFRPVPDNPFSVRFSHDLVRESIAGSTPPLTLPRLHLRVADALELTRGPRDDVTERLAHHLSAAGPLADPARTAEALVHAGRYATSKFALEAAERHLESAARIARGAALPELELAALSHLITIAGMRSMYGTTTLGRLERAEALARVLGRELEAADLLFTHWVVYAQAIQFDRARPLALRLRGLGETSGDPLVRTYGLNAWGIHQWSTGNVEEGFHFLALSYRTMVDGLEGRKHNPLRHDLQWLATGMLAEVTALHGDVGGAREILARLAAAAEGDRYATSIWATMAARTATIAGDPLWAIEVAERGIDADPDFSFVFLGTYQRLARGWGRALTGQDPAGAAAEVRALIARNLLDPTRSCVATWFGLLAEMRMAAGDLEEATAALDHAGHYLDTYGQRYSEGLILLLRARLLRARGAPEVVVREAAERARALSAERGAHLFARRAEQFTGEDARPGHA